MIVVGASLQMQSVSAYLQDLLGVPLRVAEVLTALGAFAIASPFLVGMLRMARFFGI